MFRGFKKFNPKIDDREINIFYSTPSCYVKAVNEYVVNNNYNLSVKTDDFFPYATTSTGLWTGFYTSRPTSKRYERIANNILQVNTISMKMLLQIIDFLYLFRQQSNLRH